MIGFEKFNEKQAEATITALTDIWVKFSGEIVNIKNRMKRFQKNIEKQKH